MTRIAIGILFILQVAIAIGQEDTVGRSFKDVVSLNGYVREMQTISFTNFDNLLTDHLLHNRLNFKVYATNNLTVAAELRTRAFYGETVRLQQPYYGTQLEIDPGEVDLSWVLIDGNSFILHSTLDRAYIDYSKEKWDVRIGRQRINWGVNLVWNPNDLFNAYNFADFDYSERPGSDAVRLRYYPTAMSSAELAIKPSADSNKWVGAALYKFNKFNYDFQTIAGVYNDDYAAGLGWAGNISQLGFKGEATYFHPRNEFRDSTGVLSGAISFDYAFDNAMYINASILYNSNGIRTNGVSGAQVFTNSGTLSAKQLMPNKWSYFAQVSGPFNPALMGSMSVMYLEGLNVVFVMPSLSYSINESWDVNVVGQLFYGQVTSGLTNVGNGVFLRFQLSF